MKQKMLYSKANGAVFIFAALVFVVCFYDSLISLYHSAAASTFGKTHFIVGYPQETYRSSSHVQPMADSHNLTGRVLFSPDDDIKQELINLITHEQKSIKVAIFTFTDKDVAQALLDAHNRGVIIEIVADSAYLRDQYSKIAWLQQQKIPVFTYNPHYRTAKNNKSELMSIMHHKFVIFSKNADTKSYVWTGSFNFTRSANARNQENVIILDDVSVVNKYSQQFNRLKKRCDDCYEETLVTS